MGILDLTAKNPFGKDLDMAKPKTWIGLGVMAGVVVVFGGMVMWIKGKSSVVETGLDGLHARLRGG